MPNIAAYFRKGYRQGLIAKKNVSNATVRYNKNNQKKILPQMANGKWKERDY